MSTILIEHEVELEKFIITGDVEKLRKSIEGDRGYWEEDAYTMPHDDFALTKSEYEDNIDDVLNELDNCIKPEYLKLVIEQFPKKKNGTFKKNYVREVYTCNNSQYWEDSYGYNVNILRFKCVDDRRLELQYFNTVVGY